MCLAIPGKIIEIQGTKAKVDFDGIQRNIDLSFIDSPKIDEYVLVHTGFAIQKIDQKIAEENYRLLNKLK